MVSRTIFLKTNNFRRIRRALLAYVRCGGLALKGLINIRKKKSRKLLGDYSSKDWEGGHKNHNVQYQKQI